MNYLKSYFWYNKSQRNGILFLLSIIIVLQMVYVFVDFSFDEGKNPNQLEILAFQKQIDSLKLVKIESRNPKMYPFNPNYITDYKGYKLGMTTEEIDRLHSYRKKKKFINSINEFQKITKISDSLLHKISPYFKFPAWVVKQTNTSFKNKKKESIKIIKISTTDLNLATAQDFQTIKGIGEGISNRILKYKKRLQGFSFESQLYEVWGLDTKIADKIISKFKIINKPKIKKININTATFKEALKNPYIDYKLCKKIFEYRDEMAELQSISELKNIENFPLGKYDRIILYLTAK